MSATTAAHDPSVRFADTSPSLDDWGGIMKARPSPALR